MRIGIIGINHKSASLPLRERLSHEATHLFGPFHIPYAHFSSILLSTCNRTEIYFHSEDLAATHIYLLNVIREHVHEEFEHCVYSYFGKDCFLHLAKVTAGFDSALVGETEIQGQVKRAYENTHSMHALPHELHFLFQKCLKIGKEIRTQIGCFHPLPSIEHLVVQVGQRVVHDLSQTRILFVGLSEINLKILKYLKQVGASSLSLCNRSESRALSFAQQEGLSWLPWNRLHLWPSYDFVIFGTRSPKTIAYREDIVPESPCKLVVDLGLPRNVDPKVATSLTLFNIDQLHRTAGRKSLEKAAEWAHLETHVIVHAVKKQVFLFHSKNRHDREESHSLFFSCKFT
ncbi:MAG: glutamyl-tRNA reductase [Chlamydiia bacterium]|nr:glutamyl-tRNA reductase [Chlamydiia bacterium]